MSSPITAKRRKLNETSKTLRKPFVSPLKSTKLDCTPLQHNNASNVRPYQPSTLAHTISQSQDLAKPSKEVSTSITTLGRSTPVRKNFSYSQSSARTRNPAEQAAQRALSKLEMQIRTTRNEIDTLKQAAHLNVTSTDADLEDLTIKWRQATQAAAEELFGTVKERVCRMGGVAAWKESEKQKQEKMNQRAQPDDTTEDDEADCEFDEEGEELPEDEVAYRKKEKARARQEMMDAMEDAGGAEEMEQMEREKKVWQEVGKEDDSFTMDMMLRSLNIDLNLIGWDKEAQRWVS